MSGECNGPDVVEDCDACISAQKHYYERLVTYGCDPTEPADARATVVKDCDGSMSDKASYLEGVCSSGGTPAYDCE